jgi:hypothetical protein
MTDSFECRIDCGPACDGGRSCRPVHPFEQVVQISGHGLLGDFLDACLTAPQETETGSAGHSELPHSSGIVLGHELNKLDGGCELASPVRLEHRLPELARLSTVP